MGGCRKYTEVVCRLVLSSWMTVTAPSDLQRKGPAERKILSNWSSSERQKDEMMCMHQPDPPSSSQLEPEQDARR